ncbi:MAG: DUF5320 domain-containing protein, partial [Deltaproteobacteria bacterium]|nr:DUF5320 domain-containing protein [Deltaproteobacteria bacterium]
GMGRGMGMGRVMGDSAWGGSAQPESTPLSKEEELKRLKNQENDLRKQIEAIESGINALKKK